MWSGLRVTRLLVGPVVDLMHVDLPARQIDIDAALVGFGVVLKTQLLTYLFYAWLNLLYVTRTVVAFADNNMQICLTLASCLSYARLQDVLGFLHKLAMQVDGVGRDTLGRIVLAKDELGCLLVVLFHSHAMLFALVRERFGRRPVTAIVCFLGALETLVPLLRFLSCQVS